MSHTPTNAELNRAMAESLGWTFYGKTAKSPADSNYAMEHDGRQLQPWPDYCADRNHLPEIWRAVENRHQYAAYLSYIRDLDSRNREQGVTATGFQWHVVTAPSRLHVIAALKALGRWETDWEVQQSAIHLTS